MKKIKQWWKKLKYWQKGAVFGSIVALIPYILFYLIFLPGNIYSDGTFLCYFPGHEATCSFIDFLIWQLFVLFIYTGFFIPLIIGSLIGFIIGKVKGR